MAQLGYNFFRQSFEHQNSYPENPVGNQEVLAELRSWRASIDLTSTGQTERSDSTTDLRHLRSSQSNTVRHCKSVARRPHQHGFAMGLSFQSC